MIAWLDRGTTIFLIIYLNNFHTINMVMVNDYLFIYLYHHIFLRTNLDFYNGFPNFKTEILWQGEWNLQSCKNKQLF